MIRDKRATFDATIIGANEQDALYRLTYSQASQLMSVTSGVARWKTRWYNYNDFDAILAYVDDLTYRLMTPVTPSGASSANKKNDFGTTIIYDCDECEDSDMRVQYQVFNGLLYIGVPCDCGGYDWYPVGQSAPIAPNGAPSAPNDMPAIGTWFNNGVTVSQDKEDCYRDNAVEYLCERFMDAINRVAGVAAIAFDAFSPVDEVLNLAGLQDSVVDNTNIVQEIASLGAETIRQELFSASVQSELKSAWEFSGELRRIDLQAWAGQAPLLSGVVPIFALFAWWSNLARLRGINYDLGLLAQQCETGNAVYPLPPGSGASYTDGIFAAYPMNPVTFDLLTTGDTQVYSSVPADAISLYVEWYQTSRRPTNNNATVENGVGDTEPLGAPGDLDTVGVAIGPTDYRQEMKDIGLLVSSTLSDDKYRNLTLDEPITFGHQTSGSAAFPVVFTRVYYLIQL